MYVDATMKGEKGGWALGNNPGYSGNPVTIEGGKLMCNIPDSTRWTIYYERTNGHGESHCLSYEQSYWDY